VDTLEEIVQEVLDEPARPLHEKAVDALAIAIEWLSGGGMSEYSLKREIALWITRNGTPTACKVMRYVHNNAHVAAALESRAKRYFELDTKHEGCYN
jgi:hypothetical protein